jgi:hypothetical protein
LELAVFVVSDINTAPIITVFGEGKEAGAVYSPAVVIVPTVLLPPATPFTLQLEGWEATEFERNPLNCCVWLMGTMAEAGETVKVTGGGGGGGGGLEPPPHPAKPSSVAIPRTTLNLLNINSIPLSLYLFLLEIYDGSRR